ncbi:NAD-dependent epimerase/dehydratase family protein [Lishizhenia sp.]|uniref:NAD-dependent epimerase/dehydratase family protein n=1 Tax=Lishizhenia sp. TaxID=2497594 RepID=UPI00299F16D8|nr:NAD-dependent epimerase/dehydratase family protein [Lishizhenia sp.]MDX1445290.1 NAD-dependent epimerase/dehydratase family protein [Lishizhenia sp.]
MKILITGGAGFIGSNLCKRLVNDGHDVTVLDNLLRGNKIDPEIFKKIHFIKGDVRNYSIVNTASKGVDIIYHFAAVLGVDVVADNPVETMDVEVIGTRNVVAAAQENNIKKILYASTSGIYGHSAIENALSEEILVDPRTSYAMAKRYNEIYLASHHDEKGLEAVSLRFFNVYGDNQDNRMVIPRFFEQAQKGEQITVYGNGEQTRDFTYIDDTIEACVRLMDTKGYHIVNIANEEEWNIKTLAENILEITGSNSKIAYIDAPRKRYDYEVERRVGSSKKLKELVNYKPTTPLLDGLKMIYKKNN